MVTRHPMASNDVCRMTTTVTKKSWVPVQEELLQKMATQSLIHEMSIQANESAAIVVPWFLSSMPVNVFHEFFMLRNSILEYFSQEFMYLHEFLSNQRPLQYFMYLFANSHTFRTGFLL